MSIARSRRLPGLFVTILLPACGGASAAPPASTPASAPAADVPPTPASASSAAPPKATESEPDPESVVQVAFEPLVTGVRPGGHLVLAAHFRIAKGYRISWKYPGEVGSATTVTFRAPPGFEVGATQFPAPERYTAQGHYVGYGYHDEVAVFAEVTAKSGLRSDDVTHFDMDASWVACKKDCASERTSAFVELPTVYGPSGAADVAAAVAPFRARVPSALADVHDAETKWAVGERDATLSVKMPSAAIKDFIPDGTGDPLPTKTSITDTELRFTYDEAPHPGSRPLRGVIAVSANGKDAFYDFEAPLPGVEPADRADKGPKNKKKRY